MKRTIAILLCLIILVIMLLPNITNASGEEAQVKISTDATLVEVGDTVKITITQYKKGTSELRTSKYIEFKLSFNNEIFSYVDVTEGFNVEDVESNGNLTVKTEPAHQTEDISSVTLTFKALKSTIRNEGNFNVLEFKSGENSGSAQKTN